MDLALSMGCSVDALAERITEREFQEWQQYAARKMLPARRLEMYLAQIAHWIASTMGGVKDAPLSDFMFDPLDSLSDDDPGADTVAEAKLAFSFQPRTKRTE